LFFVENYINVFRNGYGSFYIDVHENRFRYLMVCSPCFLILIPLIWKNLQEKAEGCRELLWLCGMTTNRLIRQRVFGALLAVLIIQLMFMPIILSVNHYEEVIVNLIHYLCLLKLLIEVATMISVSGKLIGAWIRSFLFLGLTVFLIFEDPLNLLSSPEVNQILPLLIVGFAIRECTLWLIRQPGENRSVTFWVWPVLSFSLIIHYFSIKHSPMIETAFWSIFFLFTLGEFTAPTFSIRRKLTGIHRGLWGYLAAALIFSGSEIYFGRRTFNFLNLLEILQGPWYFFMISVLGNKLQFNQYPRNRQIIRYFFLVVFSALTGVVVVSFLPSWKWLHELYSILMMPLGLKYSSFELSQIPACIIRIPLIFYGFKRWGKWSFRKEPEAS